MEGKLKNEKEKKYETFREDIKDIAWLNPPYSAFAREIVWTYGGFSNNPPKPFISFIKFLPDKSKLEIQKYLTLRCPCCKYERTVIVFKDTEAFKRVGPLGYPNIFSASWINGQNVQKSLRGFYFHMESRVRLSGDKKHMKMMINLFGKEYTLEQLKRWSKKSIFVAGSIDEFIKSINKKKGKKK